MSKHTPGPWRIEGDRDSDYIGVFADRPPGGPICEINQTFGQAQADEANAHLIAAAPDFLDACQGPDPDVDRLSWLSALLTELEDNRFASECEDPDAMRTALLECRLLADGLRAAVIKAKGGAP